MADNNSGNNLIIGLGGTGGRVLKELRKQMRDKDIYDSKDFGFLYIDSSRELVEAQDNPFSFSEFVDLCLKKEIADDIANQIDQFPHLANISNGAELLRNYKEGFGAQQNRRLGRVLLLAHSSYYSYAIHHAINQLIEDSHNNKLTVTIVTGLSGGTGSGILIDIISCIYKKNKAFDIHVNVIGVLPYVPLPTPACDAGRYYANAYATLRELNALNTGNYPLEENIKKTIKRFNLHLYSNVTEEGEHISPEYLTQIISCTLFDLYFGTASCSLSRFNEIAMYKSMPECEDNLPVRMKCAFGIGLRKIIYPYKKILRRLSYDLAIQACNKLLYNNYVLQEGDNLLETKLHYGMNVNQTCKNGKIYHEVKGYVNERKEKYEFFSEDVKVLERFGIAEEQLTLQKSLQTLSDRRTPYELGFIRYANKFKDTIIELNKNEAIFYLNEFKKIKALHGKLTGDVKNILEYLNRLPIYTFNLFRDDPNVPTDISRFDYLQRFTSYFYDVSICPYFRDETRWLHDNMINRIEKILIGDIINNGASIDDVITSVSKIEDYLNIKIKSCDVEIDQSEKEIDIIRKNIEDLFNLYANLSLMQRIILPKEKMCAMIDGLWGMFLLEKLSLLGKHSKREMLPILIQGCQQMHNDLLHIKDKVLHASRTMKDITSSMEFPEEIDMSFKEPIVVMYKESDYHCLLKKVLDNKDLLDGLLNYTIFGDGHRQSFSSLNNYTNITIDKWYQCIGERMKHDMQIRQDTIYEACEKYLGKNQTIDFIKKMMHKSGTYLPLNPKECGRNLLGQKSDIHSPIIKVTIVERPKAYSDTSDMIESVTKEENLGFNCISIEDNEHPTEITIMTVCTNFALRTIAALPTLKHQYDLLMKQDKQKAVSILHIENSCTDIPSIELREK